MNNENKNKTPATFDINEYKGLVLAAFDHAIGEMDDGTREEARQFVRLYFKENDPADASPAMFLMTGFLMGLSEGMRIADSMRAAATEKTATH